MADGVLQQIRNRLQKVPVSGGIVHPRLTQVAAALAVLAAKGEKVEELAGMAEAMRDRAIQVRSRHARFIDTAGTGSSRAKTFNVSTAAAFVIAGAGLPVDGDEGNRIVTPG